MTFLVSQSSAINAQDTMTCFMLQQQCVKRCNSTACSNLASQQQRACLMQAGTWQAGRCMSEEVADTVRVQDAINDSLLNKPHGFPRLYFTDGTFPGELPEGVTCQDDLPGQKTFSRLCLFW